MNELRRLILDLDDDIVLALNAYFEARGEYKRLGEPAYSAVMAVVLNRAAHPSDWEASVQEVVAAHRQFSWTNHDDAITDPQYAFALKFAREPQRPWDQLWMAAKDVAARMVQQLVRNPVANATFYFNPQICAPAWARKLKLIRDLGNHRFMAAPGDPAILWPGPRETEA